LVRHAYVMPTIQRKGVGTRLLRHVEGLTGQTRLDWYLGGCVLGHRVLSANGFTIVPNRQKDSLLRKYWSIPRDQVETSLVLADGRWMEAQQRAANGRLILRSLFRYAAQLTIPMGRLWRALIIDVGILIRGGGDAGEFFARLFKGFRVRACACHDRAAPGPRAAVITESPLVVDGRHSPTPESAATALCSPTRLRRSSRPPN